MTTKLHDLGSERAYLQFLLCTADADELQHPERLEPGECASAVHARILEAIHALHVQRQPIDNFTVPAHIERDGFDAAVREALQQIDATEDWLGSVRSRVEQLRHLARIRATRAHLQRGLAAIEDGNLDDALGHAATCATEGRSEARKSDGTTLAEAAWRAVQHVEIATTTAEAPTMALAFGYHVLNDAMRMWPRRSMITIGGRTGCGKSTLMLGLALHAAKQYGCRAGIVSLEDPAEVWGARGLSFHADINPQDLLATHVAPPKVAQIERGLKALEGVGVHIEYALNRPVDDVLRAMRSLVVQKGCDVLFVDYLQAVKIRSGKGDRYDRAVAEAAQDIKAEAQALGVSLALGSQLRRPDGTKAYAEPSVHELKETGDLENMSEAVLLLWKTSDKEDARMLGKIAKVKWSPKRPRFELQINPSTGALADIVRYESSEESASRHDSGRRHWGQE